MAVLLAKEGMPVEGSDCSEGMHQCELLQAVAFLPVATHLAACRTIRLALDQSTRLIMS